MSILAVDILKPRTTGVAVTVGTGKTMVIDVLQIGDIET